MGNSIIVVAGTLLLSSLCLVGCNNCENMIEKMCSDLGTEDCAYWKQRGWDRELIPGGRGVTKACGMMMGDNVYPKLLASQKNLIKVNREAAKK